MATAEKLGFRETIGAHRGPFRRYFFGESISLTGTWMQMMAQGRVMAAVAGLAFFGLMPIAAVGISSLVDPVGMRAVMAANAVIFAAGAAYILSTQAKKACEVREPAVATPAEAAPAESVPTEG